MQMIESADFKGSGYQLLISDLTHVHWDQVSLITLTMGPAGCLRVAQRQTEKEKDQTQQWLDIKTLELDRKACKMIPHS